MYNNGRGVQRDYTEAVRWYRRAADQGHAGAKEFLDQQPDRTDSDPRG
jgi:hypothetical protein